MKQILLFALFILSISPAFGQNQLSEEQSRAIQKAKRYGLPMSRVDVSIAGVNRTILILGETHFKDGQTAKEEMELITHFDTRLIEDYWGSGKKPTWSEKAILKFTSIMFPLLQKTKKNGQPSTLQRIHEKGFFRYANGYVYYNHCYVGRVTENGFYVNKANNQTILQGLPHSEHENYKNELLSLGRNSIEVRAATMADRFFTNPTWKSCPNGAVSPVLTKAKTYSGELGELAKWDKSNVCGDLVCTYKGSGRPSKRELRMVENFYLTLKSNPEAKTALILVGADHIKGIQHLLTTWEAKRTGGRENLAQPASPRKISRAN